MALLKLGIEWVRSVLLICSISCFLAGPLNSTVMAQGEALSYDQNIKRNAASSSEQEAREYDLGTCIGMMCWTMADPEGDACKAMMSENSDFWKRVEADNTGFNSEIARLGVETRWSSILIKYFSTYGKGTQASREKNYFAWKGICERDTNDFLAYAKTLLSAQ